MELLSPRLAIPLSDEEIVRLYEEANRLAKVDPEHAEQRYWKDQNEDTNWETGFAVIDFLILGFTFVAAMSWAQAISTQIWTFILVVMVLFPVICFGIGWRFGTFAIGPIGLVNTCFKRVRERGSHKPRKIDPNQPYVLATVVDHLAKIPISRSETLQREIQGHRKQIERTLSELPGLISAFGDELKLVEDPEVELLVASRRDAARQALSRLQEVDANLQLQIEQAKEAVVPLVRMVNQFSRYRKLSQSLSRIQEAHDLAVEGEERVNENRVELRALYASSFAAQARLAEIQSVMESTERAREEVRQLMA